jgi:hypothetical protein
MIEKYKRFVSVRNLSGSEVILDRGVDKTGNTNKIVYRLDRRAGENGREDLK